MPSSGPVRGRPRAARRASRGRAERRPSSRRAAGAATAPLGKRCTSVERAASAGPTAPTITRPLDAPRSTAATTDPATGRSPQERGGDAGVDGDVQPGGVAQSSGPHSTNDGVGDVLGQHLALEQGALRVERAELLLRRRRRPRPASRPSRRRRCREPRTTPSGLTPLTLMPCSPSSAASSRTWWAWSALVGAVGDVVRAGEDRVLARRCRRCRRRSPGRSSPARPPWRPGTMPLAITSCWRSQSASVVSSSGLEIDSPALLTTRSSPPKASTVASTAACTGVLVGHVRRDADGHVACQPISAAAACGLLQRRGRR